MTSRHSSAWLDKPLEVITPEDVAAFLKCSVRTVRRSSIRCVQIGQRKVRRYQVRDVLEWIEQSKERKPDWVA